MFRSVTVFGGALAVAGLMFVSTATAMAQSQTQPQQAQPQPQPLAPAPPPPPNAITISTSSGTTLWLDGLESDKLPVEVQPGTQVCVPEHTVYKSEGERFIFQQWSTGATDDCIAPTKPGGYRAQYLHQVLLVIKSDAPGIQRSMWVTYGEPQALDVPTLVQV